MNQAELNAAREALAEIRRELKMRDIVYPRLAVEGRLPINTANDRIRAMREAERIVGMYVAEHEPYRQKMLFPSSNPMEGR